MLLNQQFFHVLSAQAAGCPKSKSFKVLPCWKLSTSIPCFRDSVKLYVGNHHIISKIQLNHTKIPQPSQILAKLYKSTRHILDSRWPGPKRNLSIWRWWSALSIPRWFQQWESQPNCAGRGCYSTPVGMVKQLQTNRYWAMRFKKMYIYLPCQQVVQDCPLAVSYLMPPFSSVVALFVGKYWIMATLPSRVQPFDRYKVQPLLMPRNTSDDAIQIPGTIGNWSDLRVMRQGFCLSTRLSPLFL